MNRPKVRWWKAACARLFSRCPTWPRDGGIECLETPGRIRVLRRLQLLEHPRVAADGTLTEDDEAARQDVRPLDRDRHRHTLVGVRQIIAGPLADRAAAMDVHGIVDGLALALGGLVLEERRDHGRLEPLVEGRGGQAPRRLDGVGIAGDAGEHLLDPLEASDRELELLADPGIGTGVARTELDGRRRQRRERNGTPDRQPLHEHAPALPDLCAAADDHVHGDEHVGPRGRTVLEGLLEGVMAAPDPDPRVAGRDEGQRDPEIVLTTQQPFGVIELERRARARSRPAPG